MLDCNYCGDYSYEDIFSLRKWANGGYCSLECVSKDIINHEDLINYYANDINMKRHKYGINHLSIEEENALNKSLQRRTVLLQKLTLIRSLMKTGSLKYED